MKINMREVMEAKNKITSSRNKLQAEINRAKSDWKTVQGSDALSGKVKTAINGEIGNYQLPMLTNYYDLLHTIAQEMEKTISDFKASVKENSDSAIIDTDALNEAKGKFSTPLSNFAKLDKKISNIYSSVAHIVPISAPSNQFNKKMEEAKKVLTETLKGMDTFNGRKAGSAVKDKLAQQSSQITNVGGLSYSNPKSLEIFTDKTFKNEIKEAHKKVQEEEKDRLAFEKDHPILMAMDGNLTEEKLDELDKLINHAIAKGVVSGKKYINHMKKLYISSRIKRLPNGKLVMRRAKGWLKKLDQLADIDDYVPKGHRSLSITASGTAKEFTKLGDKLLGKLDLVDKKSILRESGEAFSKASIKVEVVQGISKSEKQARKDGLKGQEITASKVGGALVDVGKVAVTTAAIGAAGAVAGFFGAPVVVVVGAGMLVGALADFSIKKSKVVDKAKKGVNSLVKGVSGWFK